MRLLEKADDLAVRIAALREEEMNLRAKASRFEVQTLSSVAIKMETD